jgi:hypothetical protein
MSERNPPLRYPASPAVRASVHLPGESVQVSLIRVRPGERFDICLPATEGTQANGLLQQMSERTSQSSSSMGKDVLGGMSKVTGAGQLYLDQVKQAERRFSRVAEEIAQEFSKTGKYTSQHAAQLMEARQGLTSALRDVYPDISFYRVAPPAEDMVSTVATQRLASDVAAMDKLEGRPLANLTRNASKRGLSAPTYLDEVPVIVDQRLARYLAKADRILIAVEIAPAIADLMTARSEQEQKKAIVELAAKGTGMAADKLASAATLALCVSFGAMTAGWGFLACGVLSVGTGIAVGSFAEGLMRDMIPVQVPGSTPLP